MSNNNKTTVIGVDVGGTFTDVFFLNEATHTYNVAKVPTTLDDQSRGILEGVAQHVDNPDSVSTLVHGTTTGTNALLERKGAKAGLITTRGFRDVLEMRRRDRPHTWGLWGQFDPIIDRNLRLEVDERVLADGTIHTPVDTEQVRQAALDLIEKGAESICIFFMNSYANMENELTAVDIVKQVWHNHHISVSAEILPEIREFERGSTAALNAYLQPPVGNYMQRLQTGLINGGFNGTILIVQSNGGVMSVDTTVKLPVRTALSGPAAGVFAGTYIGVSAGYPNLVTCDMGGTSFDVSLVADGKSQLAAQTSIDFGMVVRTPMIEIKTIGAGGGSIAWVDKGGLLQVGPESAGSDPGPVCYGQGNTRPTVTDANLVMGRINADRPIGGKLDRLDVEAAKKSIDDHIAKPLSIDVMAAAEAIIKVANSLMAGAIRLVSIERGHDPNDFVAMPFGGGGALHSGALIKEVGLSKTVVPRFPGVTSALGCVIADMRHDWVQTLNVMLADLQIQTLQKRMMDLIAEGEDLLQQASVSFENIQHIFELDMLYLGQTHTISVKLPIEVQGGKIDISIALIQQAFETAYGREFGRLLDNIPIRVMNFRVSVIGKRPKFDLTLLAPEPSGSLEGAKTGTRQVWIDGQWHTANVYDRLPLPIGCQVDGPALLEQADTTIFIEHDLMGEVDKFGNFIIARK